MNPKPKGQTLLNVNIDPGKKRKLSRLASESGKKLSEFVREALDFYANLGTETRDMLFQESRLHGVDPAIVVRNILIRWYAESEAEREVYGAEHPPLEFSITDSGRESARHLFNVLFHNFSTRFGDDMQQAEVLVKVHELGIIAELPDPKEKGTFVRLWGTVDSLTDDLVRALTKQLELKIAQIEADNPFLTPGSAEANNLEAQREHLATVRAEIKRRERKAKRSSKKRR
jgi:hypothetical protein